MIPRVPHTFVLIFALTCAMAVLTYILPAGAFARRLDAASGRQLIVPGSYQVVPRSPQNALAVLAAPIRGLTSAAEIVAFVLIVGGAFGVIGRTGAIHAGIGAVLGRLEGRAMLIIPICTLLTGLGGTTIGMSEETLPFYMILIPLLLALGYDSMTAVAIIFVGSTAGAVGSTLNPFATGLAQAIVGLAPGSGAGFRALIWAAVMAVTTSYVTIYAHRVRRDPARSLVFDIDKTSREQFLAGGETGTPGGFTILHKSTLAALVLGLIAISWGVLKAGWYITEIAMCFMGIAILTAAAGRIPGREACEAFTQGTRDIIGAVLVIGFARGVMVVAQDGHILDTMLFAAARWIDVMPKWLFVNFAFCIQFLFGLIVPSSSAAAATTMPVMGPLADLAGVSQQQNVTAYQLGHGIAILFTPTSGPLVAGLAIARIPWATFMRFIAPLVMLLMGVAFLALAIGDHIHY